MAFALGFRQNSVGEGARRHSARPCRCGNRASRDRASSPNGTPPSVAGSSNASGSGRSCRALERMIASIPPTMPRVACSPGFSIADSVGCRQARRSTRQSPAHRRPRVRCAAHGSVRARRRGRSRPRSATTTGSRSRRTRRKHAMSEMMPTTAQSAEQDEQPDQHRTLRRHRAAAPTSSTTDPAMTAMATISPMMFGAAVGSRKSPRIQGPAARSRRPTR